MASTAGDYHYPTVANWVADRQDQYSTTMISALTNTTISSPDNVALYRAQVKRTTETYEQSLVMILRAIESGKIDAARQAVIEAITRIVAGKFE